MSNTRYKIEEGQIYRRTDDELSNDLIDEYEIEQNYKTWQELDPETQKMIMESEWKLQQDYELYCRHDLHE